jgi:hypothetical protein
MNASVEQSKLKEERELARIQAIEAWTIKNLGEHIVVSIADKRIKQLRSFEDVACARCHQMLYQGRGICIEAAEQFKIGMTNTSRPTVNIQTVVCAGCKEPNKVMV